MEASLPVSDPPRLFVVMGVAGCGKSTIADGIATELGGTYLDGDAFHPPANIAKMSAGEPLTDNDRWPWLEIFAREIASHQGIVVGACSSLKRSYRDFITLKAQEPVRFVYLNGSRSLIANRMNVRTGHFMPPSLLNSQFAALEVPAPEENAISVDIEGRPQEIISDAVTMIRLNKTNSSA